MSFDPEFLDLMPHTIWLTAPTSRDAQGKPTYVGGTRKSYRARVFGIVISDRSGKSTQQAPAFMMYVANGNDVVEIDYKLELPTDPVFLSQIQSPFIYAIERLTDEDGNHHSKLVCGFKYSHQTAL